MSQLTRRAIIDCTLKLAQQKAINKITVRDIVDECGITRNTFYYYFSDIYDVLDEALRAEIEKIRSATDPDGYENALFDFVELVVSHQKLFFNLYKTLGQERLSSYLTRVWHETFMTYLRGVSGSLGISEDDLGIIAVFYEEAMLGIFSRWIRGQAQEDLRDTMARMRVIFRGQLPLAIENCRKNPQKND